MIRIIDDIKRQSFLNELLERNQQDYRDVEETAGRIIADVRQGGDEALRRYALRLDGVELNNIEVTEEEKDAALRLVDSDLTDTLRKAWTNIRDFHLKEAVRGFTCKKEGAGIVLGRMVSPLDSAGIYVPGGKAVYPSTVLMNAVPAKIAGVGQIIMVTPPQADGSVPAAVLAAAHIAGVDRVFKSGGVQAIAALAYGTETIPKVSKITGPGNAYVAAAKRCVYGTVGIDMTAGPSEILIIADDSANPEYIAADMIAQAEHDPMASSILLTESPSLGKKVAARLLSMTESMERRSIIEESLSRYGAIIITDSMKESIDLANYIAPEHLELMTANCFEIYRQIKNAGAIFLGQYSPEPVGDYFAGPNHTLPTCSTARFSSALSIEDFVRKTSVVYYDRQALTDCSDDIMRLALCEGLTGHLNAVRCRLDMRKE